MGYIIKSDGTILKKKKKEEEKNKVLTIKPFTYSDNNTSNFIKEDSFERKKTNNSWVDAGALSDGYQFGDISKTILGTGANVASGVLKGVSDVGFGTGKLVAGGVAQVADLIGQDELANKVRNRIAGKDEEYNKRLKAIDVFGNINEATQNASVLGKTGNEVVKSIGQIAGYGAASVVNPALGSAAMFGSSAGESLGEAYSKENVTNEQAWTKALVGGGISLATERLFGLFGKSGLDTAVANKISSKLTSGMSKQLARLGVQATSEATEELLEYAGNQLLDLGIDAASNGKGAKFHKDWNWEEVGQQMAIAAVASGIVGAGTKAIGIRNTQGSNLQEKINNYALQEDIQEGLLPPQESPLEKLQRTNIEQRQQINQQVEQELATRRNGINQELSLPTVSTEGMNLMESASRYNIKPETQSAVQNLMENRGIESRWDATRFNDNSVNALWTKDANGNRSVIFNPNASLDTIVEEVAVHELTHDILSSKNTTLNSQEVLNYVKTLQGYNEARQSLENTYSTMYDPNSAEFNSLIDEEVVADVLGRKLGNQEFINQLVNSKPSFAKSIYNWVVSKLNSIVNKGKVRSEKLYWQNIKNNFENAYKQEYKNKEMASTKYKVSEPYSILDNKKEFELGTYQKGLSKTDRSYDYNKVYEFGIRNGGKGDNVQVSVTKNGYVWNNAMLSDSIKGKGEGTKIALDLNQQSLKETGKPLRSLPEYNIVGTKNHTEEGKGLWESLVRKGYAVKNSDNTYTMKEDAIPGNEIKTDNQGRQLSKQQQEYFKDSKVRDENGNLMVMYHGTEANVGLPENERFTIFDRDKAGNNGTYYGAGFYFTPYSETAQDYAKSRGNVYETYLNMTNPYIPSADTINKDGSVTFAPTFYEDFEQRFRDELPQYWNDDLTNKQKGRVVRNILEDNGYDGIINGNTYVVFESNQIKNVDNTNPTSNEDIRYSKENAEWNEFLDKNITTDNEGRKLSKEQQEYFKDSKARDENGNLEVVYHGSNKAGFTTFSRNYNFYTNKKDVSQTYTGSSEIVDTKKLESIFDAKSWLKGITDEFYIEDNKVYDYDGEKILEYKNTDELLKNLKRNIQEEIGNTEAGGIYEGYLNITNPLIVNCNGDKWSGIDINGIEDNIDSIFEEFGASTFKENGAIRTSTNDIASAVSEAVDTGALDYDGIIFKNIIDEGMYSSNSKGNNTSDVYVTFNSNQFKAVDNTTPTSDADIRYSKQSEEWDKWNNRTIAPEGTKTKLGNIKLPTRQKASLPTKTTTEAKTSPTEPKKPISKSTLTQAETKELNDLKMIDEAIGLDSEEEARMKFLEKKQQGYVERYSGLKKITDFKEISREYGKYKDLSDFNDKLLKDAEKTIQGYRNTGRRTKTEWLDIAKNIGSNYKGNSEGLTKYAIQSWFEAQPNQKDTLNRQGDKYVDFKIQEWVNAVYDGARIGELEKPLVPIAQQPKKETTSIPMVKNNEALRVESQRIANEINKNETYKQKGWLKTAANSDVLKDSGLIKDLDPSQLNYVVQSNKSSVDKANNTIETLGYEKSLDKVKQIINDDKLPSASDVALMQRMIQEAAKRGDAATVQDLIMDTAIVGTDLGQATQALSIIQRLTPEGQLKLYTKLVQRAKVRGEKSFQNVEITPEMVENVLGAYNSDGTYDQDDLNARVEQFKQDLADQMKSTVGDKTNAWRYLAMLGNPKTHIRNIVSNLAMNGTIKVKNAMARTLETILPVEERTKTWKPASQDVKEFARQTTANMKDIITGEAKYNEKSAIESKKQIFKNKALEKLSNFNGNALEAEDWFFSSRAFQSTLQEYLTANGINTYEDIQNNPEIVEKAKNYAKDQAEIATFRQYSKLAATINQIEKKNKGAKLAVQALMPFKKTPINVAKAGVKYSPLGLAKTLIYDGLVQLRQGNIEASQFIDNLSQGLTGTSLTLLGYALAKAGFLNGSGGDDKDDKYDSQLGNTGYSLNIGGNSYSISWLSPVAMPLLVGSNFYEQLEEQKDWDMNVVSDTLAKTLDPLNEMSFMQGLTNALQSYGSGVDKIKGSLESTAQNYVGQFFPTIFSQLASTLDDKKRSTKASNDSKYKFGEQTVRSIMYKIPGLRQKLEAATDIWGNGKEQSDNIIERAFESFIAPYSKTKQIETDLDKEIKRVYNETGETGVIPGVPNSYVKYKNETYRMSANEYTDYKKTYGQNAYNTLNKLINSNDYKQATDEDKVKMLEDVYKYARGKANQEYFDSNNIDYENDLIDKLDTLNDRYGISANTYFANKEEYDYAYQYPEKYTTIKQIAPYDKYNKYKDEITNIRNNTTNDKTETIKYINSLNMNVPQKAMFIKQYYKSFTQYDRQIAEYIAKQNLTRKEKETILKQLGFTIKDGRVYY